MRTTLLGSLLDVAARNLARGAERGGPVRVRRRSTCAAPTCRSRSTGDAARLAGRLPRRARRRRSPSRTASAALAVGPLVARSWRGGGEPADFFALKGVLEALAAQLGAGARLRGGGGAVPAPGPLRARSRSAARRSAGSARSTRWSAGAWDIEAAVGLRNRRWPPLLGAADARARRPTRT